LFAVASFTVSFGIAVASVALLSLRLRHTPAQLQGRISASSRMLTSATIPVGALAGGALGQLLGTRPALYAMAAAFIIFSFALFRSPVKTPAGRSDALPAGSAHPSPEAADGNVPGTIRA
jgi:hypothetical protein